MAFVEPSRDSITYSMLHQTFLSSPLFSFHSSALSPPRAAAATTATTFSRSSFKAQKEAGMDAALRRRAGAEALWGQQQQQSGFSGEDVAWAAEAGSLLGDEFSVDDLLDFGGLVETEEKRSGDEGEEEDEELDEEEEESRSYGAAGNSYSSSSALSYDPPPPTEIDVPADDVADLEWVSRFVDDSYSEFPSCAAVPLPPKPETRFEAKAENNRKGHAFGNPAASVEAATCAFSPVPVKAKRSKRPRTAVVAWSTRRSAPFIDLSAAAAAAATATSPSSSCSSSSSAPAACLVYDYYASVSNPDLLLEASPPPPEEPKLKKKRGRKPKQPHAASCGGAVERRCSHCGVQKTPQWRAGPMGPKTLCNACGVRYKSGRLLPEYRPACSPTFICHVHSNSHRRVLEMRRKKEEHRLVVPAAAAPAPAPAPARLSC